MGPRLDSRGNEVEVCNPFVHLAASMGPRLDSRGNLSWLLDWPLWIHLLQWGRDLIVAETREALSDFFAVEEASMGPRLDSRGNTYTARGQTLYADRFNGAAT